MVFYIICKLFNSWPEIYFQLSFSIPNYFKWSAVLIDAKKISVEPVSFDHTSFG